MFKNSDEKFFRFVGVIKATILFLAILLVGFAVFNIVSGATNSYSEQIITGVIILLMAIFIPIIAYIYVDFIAVLGYDLKAIRNKLYNVDNNLIDKHFDEDD